MGSLTDLYISAGGEIKKIGDNPHDMMTITSDGRLFYYNLQNGEGCFLGEEHTDDYYRFVRNENVHGYNYDPRDLDEESYDCYECRWWNEQGYCEKFFNCRYEPKEKK